MCRRFLVILFCCALLPSWAAVPRGFLYDWLSGPNPRFSDVATLCDAYAQSVKAMWGASATGVAVTGCSYPGQAKAQVTVSGGSVSNYAQPIIQYPGSCPSNSTLSGSTCSCNTGYVENTTHDACVPKPADCTAGQIVSSGYYDIGTDSSASPKLSACSSGGCDLTFSGESPVGSALVNGVKHYFARGTYEISPTMGSLGNTCTPGDNNAVSTSSTALPADTCAPNQVKGTVNGVTKCVNNDPGSGGTPAPTNDVHKETGSGSTTTVTNNPDGSKTTTTTTITDNGDGTTTTTTTTKIEKPDGSGSSTTKSTTAGQQTDEQAQKSQCAENPMSAGCGGDPHPVGAGDFYQAKDKTVDSVLQAARDKLMGSPLGSAASGFFNVSAGGSCPSSVWTIPYLDKTVTVDIWCGQLAATMFSVMRGVLLLVASFIAYRIAMG